MIFKYKQPINSLIIYIVPYLLLFSRGFIFSLPSIKLYQTEYSRIFYSIILRFLFYIPHLNLYLIFYLMFFNFDFG